MGVKVNKFIVTFIYDRPGGRRFSVGAGYDAGVCVGVLEVWGRALLSWRLGCMCGSGKRYGCIGS